MAVHRRQQRSSSLAQTSDAPTARRAGFTLSELGIQSESGAKKQAKKTASSDSANPSLFETVVGYPLRAVWMDLAKTAVIFILVCSLIGAVSLSPLL